MPQICLSCQFVSTLANACSNLKKSKQPDAAQTATAAATVIARRMERRQDVLERSASLWVFWVTFRLEDGSQLELQVSEEAYGALKEGREFCLCWQGSQLYTYTPAEETP